MKIDFKFLSVYKKQIDTLRSTNMDGHFEKGCFMKYMYASFGTKKYKL